MDKKALVEKVVEKLQKEVTELEESMMSMKQAAIEAPGAMQSHSDTTKFQMNALKDDVEKQFSTKNRELEILEKFEIMPMSSSQEIKSGSGIKIRDGEKEINYFFLEGGSGIQVEDESGNIFIVVGENSPMGKILFGKKAGDEIITRFGSKERILHIIEVW
ncbi:MAG: hypothetical protein AB1333_00740 [Patescibacteria group bacterium]